LVYWCEHKCFPAALLNEKKIKRLSKAAKKTLIDLHEKQLNQPKNNNSSTIQNY
jgi:predicted GIY-YIG superfamily endonuclease